MTVPSNPTLGQLILTTVGGRNAKTFHQYSDELVKVLSCSPVKGEQVGGEEGGGAVTVTILALDTILAIPDLDRSEIKCRFGEGLEVHADEDSLTQEGIISCMPPESPSVGDVLLQVSLNGGQHWIPSDTFYR